MATLDNAQEVSRAANEAYWESEASVNQIAERLGLSKGTLYGLIRPLPAEIGCPQCGTEMVYPNRTALERGFLACPSCEFEEEETIVREQGGMPVAPAPDDLTPSPAEGGAPAPAPGSYPGRTVAGAALLGMAAGLLLARGFWQR